MTYMLQGSSRHEDSAGHKGTIEAGGVQWMCAVSVDLAFSLLPVTATPYSRAEEVSVVCVRS